MIFILPKQLISFWRYSDFCLCLPLSVIPEFIGRADSR